MNRTPRVSRISVIAVAVFAAGVALVDPAAATAAPREWDVGAYDDCVSTAYDLMIEAKITEKQLKELNDGCCVTSGGILDKNAQTGCRAPGRDGQRMPNPDELKPLTPTIVGPPPGIITQNLQ